VASGHRAHGTRVGGMSSDARRCCRRVRPAAAGRRGCPAVQGRPDRRAHGPGRCGARPGHVLPRAERLRLDV